MDSGRKMMRIAWLFCAALFVAPIICIFSIENAFAQDAKKAASYVEVYYFHGNFRCANCRNMEKWTKEAIDEYFKDDEKEGKLKFQIVNLDVKGNEHFALEYQLFTKSVVLSLVKDGKEINFTNLTKIWDLLKSGEKFKAYIRDEVSKYLKDLA